MDWRWFPRIHPDWAGIERAPRRLWGFYVPVIVAAYLLAMIPPVRGWLGLDPAVAGALLGLHFLAYVVYAHTPLFDRWPAPTSAALLTANLVLAAGFPAITGHVSTPLWGIFILQVLISAQAASPSWIYAGLIAVAPAGVGALWAATGAVPFDRSVGAVLAFGLVGGILYVNLATYLSGYRRVRAQAEALAHAAAETAERQRVARNLHDTVGAALTEVSIWQDLSQSATGDESRAALARAQTRLREAIQELRGVVDTLDGADLAPEEIQGLIRARVQGLCDAAGVDLRLTFQGDHSAMPMRRAYQIVKIIEEATANAIRHGEPHHLEVRLELGDTVSVTVSDDGRGFDPEAAAPGRGLASMRERARSLAGWLTLESAPGRGTRVHLTAPAMAQGAGA